MEDTSNNNQQVNPNDPNQVNKSQPITSDVSYVNDDATESTNDGVPIQYIDPVPPPTGALDVSSTGNPVSQTEPEIETPIIDPSPVSSTTPVIPAADVTNSPPPTPVADNPNYIDPSPVSSNTPELPTSSPVDDQVQPVDSNGTPAVMGQTPPSTLQHSPPPVPDPSVSPPVTQTPPPATTDDQQTTTSPISGDDDNTQQLGNEVAQDAPIQSPPLPPAPPPPPPPPSTDAVIDSTQTQAQQVSSQSASASVQPADPIVSGSDNLLSDKVHPEDLDMRWNSWKCMNCDYFYEGHSPLMKCPRCGNEDPDKFD